MEKRMKKRKKKHDWKGTKSTVPFHHLLRVDARYFTPHCFSRASSCHDKAAIVLSPGVNAYSASMQFFP